ncbi:YqgE/AlgH family protein [Pasteurellaceae bacterium 22721_9_1]
MNLQNQLLIAMPNIDDAYFARTVIFICEHNDKGTMGLVLNQPTDLSIAEMVAKLHFMMANDRHYPEDCVLAGGPVNIERGFILHTHTEQQFMHSYRISDRLQLTTSADIIDTFGTAQAPEKYLVGLGCASWVPDQLEREIMENVWLVMPADERLIFDVPYAQRWEEAQKILGFDVHHLAHQVGYC